MQLLGEHALRDDRVRLDGASPPRAGKATAARANTRLTPRLRKPARTNRHVTDGIVGLVLVATVPRDTKDTQQTLVFRTRLDRTPPNGLLVEIRDEPARRL